MFSNEDDLLEEVVSSIKENGMPSISVSPSAGKLHTMLVSISGAKHVLEIGALGGGIAEFALPEDSGKKEP
ncbi:hypothetical protein BSU04nite_35960 [Bacillus spizizenii]|nr:hypothetical protein BSU04nite_35960 [Bacillus spizizenii]